MSERTVGGDLAAERAAVRELARHRRLRRAPVAVVIAVAVFIAIVVWLPGDGTDADERPSTVLNVLDGVVLVFLLGSIVATWLTARRTGRPLLRWRWEASQAPERPCSAMRCRCGTIVYLGSRAEA